MRNSLYLPGHKQGFSQGFKKNYPDLEKSLKLTLVLENSWNLKIVPFVLELCEIAIETVKLSLKIIKHINSFRFFWIYVMRERKLSKSLGTLKCEVHHGTPIQFTGSTGINTSIP